MKGISKDQLYLYSSSYNRVQLIALDRGSPLNALRIIKNRAGPAKYSQITATGLITQDRLVTWSLWRDTRAFQIQVWPEKPRRTTVHHKRINIYILDVNRLSSKYHQSLNCEFDRMIASTFERYRRNSCLYYVCFPFRLTALSLRSASNPSISQKRFPFNPSRFYYEIRIWTIRCYVSATS